MKPLVTSGRNLIRKWILKNKYSEIELLQEFNNKNIDLYSKKHDFLDVPKTNL